MTKKKVKVGSNTIALNKRARHEYFIEDEIEAGDVYKRQPLNLPIAQPLELGQKFSIRPPEMHRLPQSLTELQGQQWLIQFVYLEQISLRCV